MTCYILSPNLIFPSHANRDQLKRQEITRGIDHKLSMSFKLVNMLNDKIEDLSDELDQLSDKLETIRYTKTKRPVLRQIPISQRNLGLHKLLNDEIIKARKEQMAHLNHEISRVEL